MLNLASLREQSVKVLSLVGREQSPRLEQRRSHNVQRKRLQPTSRLLILVVVRGIVVVVIRGGG